MKSFLCLLFLCFVLCVSAQEALGLKLDPYSGTEAIFLNPASSHLSAFDWDINLVSAHAFAYTDYGYLKQSKLTKLASDLQNTVVIDRRSAIPSRMVDVPIWIFDENGDDKSVSIHAQVSGPAVVLDIGNRLKAGLFVNSRINVSSFDIPESFGLYELNTAFQTGNIDFNRGRVAAMHWNEIGLHLSRRYRDYAIGMNFKVLSPLDGLYLKNNSTVAVDFASNIIMIGDNQIDSQFGLTRGGAWDENINLWSSENLGNGFAVDLGLQFILEEISVGVSLLDVGYARFNDNVENYALPTTYESFNIDKSLYNNLGSVEDLIAQLQTEAPLDVNATSSAFTLGTPMALNISASMPYKDNYYISASWTQRIKIFDDAVVRDNVVSIVPRYQKKWFSAFAPVSLYEYSRPRVGLALRFAYVTIGTDHLASIFTKANWRGSDVYFRVAYSPFVKFRKDSGRRKGKSSTDCYNFDKQF